MASHQGLHCLIYETQNVLNILLKDKPTWHPFNECYWFGQFFTDYWFWGLNFTDYWFPRYPTETLICACSKARFRLTPPKWQKRMSWSGCVDVLVDHNYPFLIAGSFYFLFYFVLFQHGKRSYKNKQKLGKTSICFGCVILSNHYTHYSTKISKPIFKPSYRECLSF